MRLARGLQWARGFAGRPDRPAAPEAPRLPPSHPQFISLRRLWRGSEHMTPVLNLNYLIDYVMHSELALDWQAVLASPIPLKVGDCVCGWSGLTVACHLPPAPATAQRWRQLRNRTESIAGGGGRLPFLLVTFDSGHLHHAKLCSLPCLLPSSVLCTYSWRGPLPVGLTHHAPSTQPLAFWPGRTLTYPLSLLLPYSLSHSLTHPLIH